MSDPYGAGPAQLTAPTSALAAPSVLAPGLDQIDRNFRRVTALEQATRLPALPDLVKMDLIQSPGADEDSLTEMLLGLDDAYNNRVQQADQLGQAPPPTGVPGPGQSGWDQTRIIIAALSGNKQPRQVDPDAVKAFKLRAINKGLLDMDPSKVDNTWSPEFNRMRGEMAFDDYNDQMRGAHPGATTFERAMGLLGEFTSPAGLLHMATELDLFWDFGAIGDEISTWGDKWRAVGHSKNPLDFGAKLIDALTGPIDDIVFPIINDALLFTGVTSMFSAARVGWQGARLLEEGAAFSRLFEGSGRVGRFYDFIGGGGARNLLEMREPGLIASRLRNFEGVAGGAGKAMAAWRDLTPVVAGKQAVQTGMRLGFAAALENRMPGYASDGFSISDLPGGAAAGNALQNTEEFLARQAMGHLGTNVGGIVAAGAVTTGLELMFAPYNIFSPGTFFRHGADGLGLLSQGGRNLAGALGTTGGRAVAGAGLGALAGAVGGESTEATLEGAAAGAALGATSPALGRLLQNAQVRQGVIGALLGVTGGVMLGGDPRIDAITGAIAGTGMAFLPTNVRNAVFAQAGIHGLDKLLEGTGQRMVRTSFQMVERDQHVAVGWYRVVRRSMLEDIDPTDLTQWENDVRSLGVVGAWAAKQGIDREVAAANITWEYSSAAIDWIAGRQAAQVAGGATDELLQLARNKLLAQLRPVDIGETIPVENVIADVASRMAWQEHGGVGGNLDKVRDRARQYFEDLSADPELAYKLALEHNAKAGDTIAQLWDPRNFPDATYVPRRQRGPGMAEWASQPWKSREDVFVEYAGQHLDRLGGFNKYVPAMNDIRMARADGLFDEATLKLATDRFGRQVDVNTMKVPRDPKAEAVNEAVGDLLVGGTVDPAKVPGVDPISSGREAGRITAMRIDEMAKHEVRSWAERVADVVDTFRHLSDAQKKNWSSVLDLARMDETFAAARAAGGTVTDRQLVEMIQQATKQGVNRKSVKALVKFAQRHGVGPAALDTTLRRMADDLLNDVAWEAKGFGRIVRDESGRELSGMDALERRLKQLRQKEPNTAAEVDIDAMIGRADEATAAQLTQLKEGLEGRGYKLVHGTQFLMPEDLSFNIPTFTDVTRRHMNAVTHGNWFGRRPPIEMRILDNRRRQIALADELSKVGTDLSPEDEQITYILDRLESSLRQEQDDVARRLDTSHMQNEGFISKTLDRVKSSFTPVRVDDLGGFRKGTPERVRKALETMNLSPEEEQAVVRAVNRFRNTDFHDMGLYAIENHLRSKSQAAGFLKMLGGTRYGGRVTGRVARQAATGALVGGAIGAVGAGSDASFEERLKATLLGGATGAVVGGGLAGAVNAADRPGGIINAISGKQGALGGAALGAVGGAVAGGEDGRLEGALLGAAGGAVAGGLGGTGNIIQKAEDFRYGYLADGYARLRDSMRFTLSPFFDLSRYTEGMMLSQAAAPLRDSEGHRLVTPLNASPSRLRTRIAKQAIKDAEEAGESLTKVEAKRLAQNEYNRWMGEFNTATKASKDFDVDAIDSAGQWFRQVGILGFSPTDWMATAFANMRGTGMSAETAYHAAREMYQYGTRGRSAAELSVNFIFFPFSFQKKALTHIGEWLNDDLGRSIMIHDALKTYEVLDEKYNLDEYWREHVPFMTQLGRLNLFAYGLSPGRLGGINSQLLEGAGKVALNMFLPAGVNIRDASAGKELTDLGKQLLPVYNDISWMTHDMREVVFPELRAGIQHLQGVETPMAMESYRAQVTDGWAEFNAYRTDFEAYVNEQGATTSQVMDDDNDWWAPLKAEYERKVNEIATRYPAWWASKMEAPGNAIALEMEKKQRIVAAEVAVRSGQMPSPDNLMTQQMQAFIDQAQEAVRLVTGSTNLDFAPAQTFDMIHQMAAEFATQNPGFVDLWNKFWRHDFGDLTTPMRLAG